MLPRIMTVFKEIRDMVTKSEFMVSKRVPEEDKKKFALCLLAIIAVRSDQELDAAEEVTAFVVSLLAGKQDRDWLSDRHAVKCIDILKKNHFTRSILNQIQLIDDKGEIQDKVLRDAPCLVSPLCRRSTESDSRLIS